MIKTNLLIATIGAAASLLATSNAAVVDLGSNGSGTANGALFEVGSIRPAGTGVFDPFLSIQNKGFEQGYNSNEDNFNTKREPQWNHEIRFSDLQQTTINGVAYFGFAVDVNEPNSGRTDDISLDALRLWTSATRQNDKTTVDGNGFFVGSLGTLRYDLGENQVLYIDQHRGSGESDINIYIPVSNFAGSQPNDYVYMYQRWGNTDSTEGGFEETRLIAGITPIPELSSFFPIVGLMVAVGATNVLRRRKMAQQNSAA